MMASISGWSRGESRGFWITGTMPDISAVLRKWWNRAREALRRRRADRYGRAVFRGAYEPPDAPGGEPPLRLQALRSCFALLRGRRAGHRQPSPWIAFRRADG